PIWSETDGVASYPGDVAIGPSAVAPGYRLVVDGKIRSREIRVDQDSWPDYVFANNYQLPSLKEIEKFIKKNGHLPNIPSAEDVMANGVELGGMNKLLLEKIEQLMLYSMEQRRLLENQQGQIHELRSQLKQLGRD